MSNKFTEETKIVFRDFDPAANNTLTAAGITSNWIDMKDYHRITAIAFRTVGTGKVQAAALKVSATANGASAQTVVSAGSTNATGSLVDATAAKTATSGCGIVVLDATADECAAALSGGRYVGLLLSCATATDEFGVIYILSQPRYAASGLTATDNG